MFPTASPGGCKTKSRAKVLSAGLMEPGQGCEFWRGVGRLGNDRLGLTVGFYCLKSVGFNDGFGHKKTMPIGPLPW